MLSKNIKEEAENMPKVEMPEEKISDVDVTEDAAPANDFQDIEEAVEAAAEGEADSPIDEELIIEEAEVAAADLSAETGDDATERSDA